MNQVGSSDRDDVEEWVVKMLDDPQTHQPDLDAWMAAKPGRQAEFARVMRAVEAAGAAAATAPLHAQSYTAGRRFIPQMVAISAVVLVIIYVCIFQPGHPASPLGIGEGRERAAIETELGEMRALTLGDGSRVLLDGQTTLRADMSGKYRTVQLVRGRARFVVAKNPARPFLVRAGSGEVRATGTIFDVAYTGGLAVNLLEGGVIVTMKSVGRGDTTQKVRLVPGQQMVFKPGQTKPPAVTKAPAWERQWVHGIKSLNDLPIRDVIAETNSYGPTRIVLSDPALGDRKVFGDIDIHDPDAVAKAIADYLQLEIDRRQEGVIVLR